MASTLTKPMQPSGDPVTARPLLVVDAVSKRYGALVAVQGLSFSVDRSEVFGLLGPNGAGKTTTLEMIEGLRTIDEGHITFDGFDVGTQPREVRKRIGIQLQKASYFERLTLSELLALFGDLYGLPVNVAHLLEKVDLLAKAKSELKTLSGGQQQRFSIALALVNDPSVLFLDEPSAGLDPVARRALWGLIRVMKSEGRAVVLTTHYIEEAEALCDRVAIIEGGRIVALDQPTTLIRALVASGFRRPQAIEAASLEDVYLQIVGRPVDRGEKV